MSDPLLPKIGRNGPLVQKSGDGPSLAARVAPPLSLLVVLTALGLLVNGHRLGLDLAGGRLLPVGGAGELWSAYLSGWHPVGGGTASSAPTAFAVLGALGAIFTPLGGPPALVAVLLLGDAPLAGLTAYAATRALPVARWARAGAAASYALLPPATAAVAQGRLDVVAVHILLPPVIAGIAAVLARGGRGWLHRSSWCALGVALLGAFSPLAHGLALLGLVTGFVVLPTEPDGGRRALLRRVASVVIVVLLPLALLLPWPTVVVNEPALLLHGLGGPAAPATPAELLGLDPGGPGALPVGLVVVVAAVVAVVLRPRSLAGPGLGVAVAGVCGLAVVQLVLVKPVQGGAPAPGFAGVPLLVIGAGLLWLVLSGGPPRLPRPLGIAWAVLVVVVGVGAFLGGRGGPLQAGGGDRLAVAQADELARTGRSVLVLGEGDQLPSQSGGRLPLFGDDQLALAPGAPDRLASWQIALEQPSTGSTRAALSGAAASGALFVVLPHGAEASPIVALAPDLVATESPTRDGRQVLRLLPPAGQVVLVPPGVAKQSVTGTSPTSTLGVTPVEAGLPSVRVRVSEGVPGRLLVLGAEVEPGWRATVDGQVTPIVPAWGHQVAVAVPPTVSTVIVEHSSTLRDVLLLVEIAAVLFAALTAVPGRRRAPASAAGQPVVSDPDAEVNLPR
ncbi:hypothetical protein [Amycolatopsis taiwanensis]|nr:hypothetical protein [Amycolatopsis taiwanensis]